MRIVSGHRVGRLRPMDCQAVSGISSLLIKTRRVFKLVSFVLLFGLASCVRQQQYRTKYDPSPYPSQLADAPHSTIEVATNYTLGYVEFDDQGWLFNKQQSEAITSEL